jgi:hypothetical protein
MRWNSRVLCSFWDANNNTQQLLQRYHHASVIYQDKFMFLYGGLVNEHSNSATNVKTTNSFLKYSLESGEYHLLNESMSKNFVIPCLSHHTMTLMGDKIIIYGGKTETGDASGDSFLYNLSTEEWSKTCYIGASSPTTKSKHNSFNNLAPKRYGHTAVGIGDNTIFVFGGTDGTTYYNDLHIFDTASFTWITTKTHGQAPSPRSGHSCVLYGTNMLFVFGGGNDMKLFNDLFVLNIDSMTWAKIQPKGTLEPVKRIHHTANVLANKMILFGGIITEQDKQHDLMLFDLEDFRWDYQVLSTDTKSPPNLMGHTSVLSEDSKMWVVGGKFGDTISSLVYTLETGIRMVVEPIDFGRSNLPYEMALAVDNKNLYSDLLLEHNNQFYHLHRAMIRIRCVAFYQEYLRIERLSQQRTYDKPFVIDLITVLNRLSKRKDIQINITKLTPEVITSLLEYIYTDTVSKLEDQTEDDIDPIFIDTLARLADILSLDRLSELCKSHMPNGLSHGIPPPTLFADMAHLLTLCQSPNELHIESNENIFENSSVTTGDEEFSDNSTPEPTIEPKTPMSSLSSISLTSFVEKVLSSDKNAFTDVIFVVDEERELFAAHRFVLLCRSKFFRRMFTTVREKVIEITGIRPQIFKLVLEYLYVGNVTIAYEVAVDLLIAAEVYELERLSLMAQSVLERRLHVHNVCHILSIADSYDIEHLRHACIFFIAHHLNQVKKTIGYRKELEYDIKMELKQMRKAVRQRDVPVEEEFLFPHSTFYHDKYHRDSKKGKKGGVKKGKKKVSTPGSKRKASNFNSFEQIERKDEYSTGMIIASGVNLSSSSPSDISDEANIKKKKQKKKAGRMSIGTV